MKNTLIALIVVVLVGIVGVGAYMLFHQAPQEVPVTQNLPVATSTTQTVATSTPTTSSVVIGTSVQGRDIVAYHYGTGSDEILFVGGIHGGYEWNTTLVAYNLMDYLTSHPEVIPANETVTVIPVLNPDGLYKVVGTTTENFTQADVPVSQAQTVVGRFNANKVDLNRNFECDWQAKGVWQNTSVSGGTAAFSEPESQAIKAYVAAHKLSAAVVWYSSAGGVYSSSCHNGVSTETAAITKTYADASGYPAHESFDFYATTGDMVNWLAKLNVPAISVLLTNHTDTEWNKNQAGVTALLSHYAK